MHVYRIFCSLSIHFFFFPNCYPSFLKAPFPYSGHFVLWPTDFDQDCLSSYKFDVIHWSLVDSLLVSECLSLRIHQLPVVHQGKVWFMNTLFIQEWLFTGPTLCRPTTSTDSCYEIMTAMTSSSFADSILQLFSLSSSFFVFLASLLECFLNWRRMVKCPI